MNIYIKKILRGNWGIFLQCPDGTKELLSITDTYLKAKTIRENIIRYSIKIQKPNKAWCQGGRNYIYHVGVD